jgi:L,D-peptidoglycan transpeptidase YkuD (ErfK/YbiS/YcfS/YnhG family)
MILQAFSDGRFRLGDRWTRCALGRGGTLPEDKKREGDGATPEGAFALLLLLYRPDRAPPPPCALPPRPLRPLDGWSDDPKDPAYNQAVSHPHPFSAERLWREDDLYDLLVVLGHNQAPRVPGKGSAVFLHLARADLGATEGCVALKRPDLEALLTRVAVGDRLEIRPTAPLALLDADP